MINKLDERTELIKIIDKLSCQDRQKLYIFLAGLEAGKLIEKESSSNEDKST